MSTRESYRKGPVVLRGTQIPTQTTDARLLSRTADADWLHSDPWRAMRIQAEFIEGFGALAELGPQLRSEERRVGKECRSRWSPYH